MYIILPISRSNQPPPDFVVPILFFPYFLITALLKGGINAPNRKQKKSPIVTDCL